MRCPVGNLPKHGPQEITPPGLPLQRQWYLFNHIREYVKDALRDVVCPRPTEKMPVARKDDSDVDDPLICADDPAPENWKRKRSSHTSDSDTDDYDHVLVDQNHQKKGNRGRGRGRGRGTAQTNRGQSSRGGRGGRSKSSVA